MGSIRSPAFGLPFLLFPDFALGLFGLGAGDGMWVRMAGLLAGISASTSSWRCATIWSAGGRRPPIS